MDESVSPQCAKSTRKKKKKKNSWSEIQQRVLLCRADPSVLGCIAPPHSAWDAVSKTSVSGPVKQPWVQFSHGFMEKSLLDLILG